MKKALLNSLGRWFGRGVGSSVVSALYIAADKLVYLQLDATQRQVRHWQVLSRPTADQMVATIQALLKSFASNIPLCIVMHAEHYQLLQLDKPTVAANEISAALPWLVREFTELSAEDIALDYLDAPLPPNKSQSQIQVVITALSRWRPLCDALQQQNIAIVSLQPDEWLVRNLLPKSTDTVLVLTQLPGQELSLYIIRQQQFYVSRKLRGLPTSSVTASGLAETARLDSLVLEVQRSMDFFEAQYRQAPVKEIRLLLPEPEVSMLAQYFQQNGFTQVKPLTVQPWLASSLQNPQQQAEITLYWPALAGALELFETEELVDETQG